MRSTSSMPRLWTAADNIMTFKLAVKTLAQKNGLHATFMPKPIFGINGSGMHTNMSLFQDGKNVFFDRERREAAVSRWPTRFIAGLLAHVKGMTAITNPLVNSYKRLVPGYEAPCYCAWSASNRSALIRIPAARGPVHPGGAALPRPRLQPLSGAGRLPGRRPGRHRARADAARRDHREHLRHGRPPSAKPRAFDSLPGTLHEAVAALQKDKLICDTLGEHIVSQYVAGKEKEWDEYRTHVSDWELGEYLIAY